MDRAGELVVIRNTCWTLSSTPGALLAPSHSTLPNCPNTPVRKDGTEACRSHTDFPGPHRQEEPTPGFELEAGGP